MGFSKKDKQEIANALRGGQTNITTSSGSTGNSGGATQSPSQGGSSSSGGLSSNDKKYIAQQLAQGKTDITLPGYQPPKLEDFANANPLSDTVQSLTNQRDKLAAPKFNETQSQYMQKRGLAELDKAIQDQTAKEAETPPKKTGIGQYGAGNVNLYNRNTGLRDENGNLMTVRSMSFNEDGKEILVPTIVRNKYGEWEALSDEDAIKHYHETGEYLGKFNSVEEANAYADQLHRQQERLYTPASELYNTENLPRNPITGTLLNPIADVPKSQQVYDALFGDRVQERTNALAAAGGQYNRSLRAIAEAERKLPQLDQQIEDITNRVGMATDPAEAQRLSGQLADLKRQRDEYEKAIPTSEDTIYRLITPKEEIDRSDEAFAAHQAQTKSQQQQLNQILSDINELRNQSGWVTDPGEGIRIGEEIEALKAQAHRMLLDNPELVNSSDEALGQSFFSATAKAANQVASGFSDLLQMVFGDFAQEVWNMVGLDSHENPITWLNKGVHDDAQKLQEYYAPEVRGNRAAEIVDKYGTTIVAALPAAAMAYATAGGSMATTESLMFASDVANLSGGAQTIAQVGNAVREMSTSPNFLMSFAQEAGSSYNEALEDGMSETDATVYSMMYGYLAALVEVGGTSEVGGLQQYVDELAEGNKGAVEGIKDYVKSILAEGDEEKLQGILQRGLKSFFGVETAVTPDGQTGNVIFDPTQMWEETKGAWAAAGVMGAPGAVTNTANALRTNTETEAQPEVQTEAQPEVQPTVAETPTVQPQPTVSETLADVLQTNRNADGQVTNKAVDTIRNDPELKTAFEEATGEELTGPISEQKAIIRNNADKVVTALTGETVAENETITPATNNTGNSQQTEAEQPEGINTPAEVETEKAVETPQEENTKTDEETATQEPTEQKPTKGLTKAQQRTAEILSKGDSITDEEITKLLRKDSSIRAIESFLGESLPANQKEQTKIVRQLARDIAMNDAPDAYLVQKMAQDAGVQSRESELQYKIDTLEEQLKAKELEIDSAIRQAEARGDIARRDALREQKTKLREEQRERIAKVKRVLRDQFKSRQDAKKEAAAVKSRIKDIDNRIKALKKLAQNPREGQYIPQSLQGDVADAIAAITEDRAGSTTLATDKKLADISEKIRNAQTIEETDRYLAAWDKLAKRDARMQANFGKILNAVKEMREANTNSNDSRPEILQEYVQSIADNLIDTPFYQMNSQQLREVDNALRAIQTTIQNTVNNRILGEIKSNYLTALELRDEIANARTFAEKRGNTAGDIARAGLSRAELGWNRPEVVFNILGGRHVDSAFMSVYHNLNEAYKAKTGMSIEGREYFKQLLDDSKGVRSLRSKVTVDGIVDESGKKVEMSRGMRLYLRMLLENSDSARGIVLGGLSIPERTAYYLGINDNGFGTTMTRSMGTSEELNSLRHEYKQLAKKYNDLDKQTTRDLDWQTNIDDVVTQMDSVEQRINDILEENGQSVEDLKAAIDKELTTYEQDWISQAREFFDWAGSEIDKTNLDVYGFKKASVDNYVPIHRDPNFRNSSLETMAKELSSENWGAMKKRSSFASQPMLLMDLFDVCDSYLQKAATYSKVMPVIREFNQIWNTTEFTDTDTNNVESLRDTVRKKLGKAGVNYVNNLIADLQGARRISILGADVTGLSNALNRARGNLAKASLTMNPGVALGQTASLLSAGAKIPTRYILKAVMSPQSRGARDATINEHTKMLLDRQQGSGSIIKADANVIDRAYNKMNWLTGWIQNMDSWTVSKLWQATEYYVQDQMGISKDSEGYWDTVTDTWEEVLETTQPEYNPMQRPDILRSPNDLVKSMTMFMTQRVQNYNTMFNATANYEQAVHDMNVAKQSGNAEAIEKARTDLKARRTEFNRGISSVIASNALYVAIRGIADGLMHKWDKYRDEETGEVTKEKILERTAWMFGETMAGCIPFGNAVFTALESMITGQSYYGISVNSISNVTGALEDIVNVGKSVFSGEDEDKTLKKAYNAAKSIADMLGISASNAEKLVKSALDWYGEVQNMVENDAVLGEYYKFTPKQNKNRLYDALESGDTDKVERVIKQMGDNAMQNAGDIIKDHFVAGDIDAIDARNYMKSAGYNDAEIDDKLEDWNTRKAYDKYKADNPDTELAYEDYKRFDGKISDKNVETVKDIADALSKASKETRRDFDVLDAIASTVGTHSPEVDEWILSQGNMKDIVAARAEGIESEDYFKIYDMAKDLKKIDSEVHKGGEDTRPYTALDALLDTVYDEKVTTEEAEDIFSDNYSHLDELHDAAKLGIDSRTWYDLDDQIFKIQNDESLSDKQKNQKIHNLVDTSDLNAEQQALIKDQHKVYTTFAQQDDNYDAMVGSGKVDPNKALWYMDEWSGLEPEKGKKTVSGTQKAMVILKDTDPDISATQKMETILAGNVKPRMHDLAVWMNNNLSQSEINHYWSLCKKAGWWKRSFNYALKHG